MADETSILVVDGNAHMTTLLQRFLERHNLRVQATTSVAEAQALLAQWPFHLVLTDLFLPHRDGLSLLPQARQAASHTRVIVMVTFGTPEVCRQILAEGAYAFIKKPFGLGSLWGLLRRALQDTESPQS